MQFCDPYPISLLKQIYLQSFDSVDNKHSPLHHVRTSPSMVGIQMQDCCSTHA